MRILLIVLIILVVAGNAFSSSDPFPDYESAPAYTTYFADGTPNNTYHIATTGDDSTGDGSIGNPWASLAGAQGTAAAGDLILFHEGTYNTYTNGASSWYSSNRLTTDGTSSDYIVIMAANKHASYTGEATPLIDVQDYFGMTLYGYQVLDGINFQGGISIYDIGVVVQNVDFDEGCAGQRDGNPGAIVFPAESPYAQNVTIRNNTFHEPLATHVNGNGRNYAIVMFESNTSDAGATWNGNYTKILYNKFYQWDAPTSQKYIVYVKDSAHGVEVGHNRFYESNAFALGGFGQGTTNVGGYDVHHNLVYNCDGLGIYWGEAISGRWRSNVVIDNGYSDTCYYFGDSNSRGLVGYANSHLSDQVWGEVYDNVFYVDDPGEWYDGADATGYGYWSWVDYNGYVSTVARDLFENANGGAANWQGNAVTTSVSIVVDGSYFASIADSTALEGAGRYGGSIGGFTFTGSQSPVRSAGSPSSNVAYTTTVTLSLTTDISATCKYGTVADTAYASIANTFGTTGGTSHSDAGVAVSEGANAFYVRCSDGGEFTNTDDYTISFSVLAQTAAHIEMGSGGTITIGGSGSITIN